MLKLKGLNLDGFPLAALAAYGLLRVLEEKGLQAALAFEAPYARPVALLNLPMCREALLDFLVDHARTLDLQERGVVRERVRGTGRKGKVKEKEIVLELKDLWERGLLSQNPFFQAYLFQVRGRAKTARLVTTPFDTTKGQQGFLKALAALVELLRKDPDRAREAFRKALFEDVRLLPGDLLYRKVPRLGWHPSQFRRTADQARIATKERYEGTTRLNPAALLLAWEAIPFFPFAPSRRNPVPLGFTFTGGRYRLHLPAPEAPVDAALLRALIALAPSLGDRTPDLRVWTSVRVGSKATTDDYPCFLAPEPATAPARTRAPHRR